VEADGARAPLGADDGEPRALLPAVQARREAGDPRGGQLPRHHDAVYGVAVAQWERFKRAHYWAEIALPHSGAIIVKSVNPYARPVLPEPPAYRAWAVRQPEYRHRWQYNDRNFLCWKHERYLDFQHEMWVRKDLPGRNKFYTDYRRTEYQQYRARTRQVLRNARYNPDLYDELPLHRHGWFD
jgi:hypothetical protein